ncbi:hypothetical protein PV325_005480 [Microctonus aethiopoides]|uniref:Uncharacterized protein n=1 Tax=Microctonus aethiopoides TaxID=144406 RepID=A0AA39KLT6_9HYME|nr:hypothetical protein PV325_005480 [Microctonus aethiopoides]KAK0091113.1 hypothetical protein PV326_003713 [Microctonus aethiopoides]KAK0166225.1 hypothetical protein PV328_004666 [Microctonus aethiopoides]
MENPRIIFLTICLLSVLNISWCDGNNYDFAKILSYPELINLNVTAVDETANDAAIQNILIDMANGKLAKDDSVLIELIKKSIMETSIKNYKIKNNPRAAIKAGSNKAQILITNVTAAFTQAIFKAKSPMEARDILSRFQLVIQVIVDLKKFEIYRNIKKQN